MSIAPKITIVMAAYNSAKFIHKAIESVLQQTFLEWELIIVDDCSADNTYETISQFLVDESRIEYHRLPTNQGPAAARNLAFTLARGEWVTILDSDDRFVENRLSALFTKAIELNADIVADNHLYYDSAADLIVGKGFDLGSGARGLTTIDFVRNCGTPLLFSLSLLKPLIRKAFLDQTGVTYPINLRIGEDFYFLFLLIWKGAKTVLLNEAGYIYTMPFGWASKKLSNASRTDHNLSGWDVIIDSKCQILELVKNETPNDLRLIGALEELKNQYLREKAWRTLKLSVKSYSFFQALNTVCAINLIPYVWGKILCKLRTTQPIRAR